MKAILAIASKDLRLLARNKAAFFWVLGFPFLIALFFGAIASGGSGNRAPMTIAVVDRDGTPYSRAFLDELRKSEALRLRPTVPDSARLLVREGKCVAYVLLHPGFGRSFGFGQGDSSGIEVGLDPSRRAEAGYLKGLVTAATFSTMESQFRAQNGQDLIRESLASIEADSSRTPAERRQWVRVMTDLDQFLVSLGSARVATGSVAAARDSAGGLAATADSSKAASAAGPNILVRDVAEDENGPRSAFEVTFPSSVMWALIGVCMSFAISIVHERVRGTFLRLQLAPISRGQILGGKALAAFLASLGTTALLLAVGASIFHVRVTNLPELVAALVACAFCFVGVMMVVAVLGHSHQAVSGAGWAILLVMSMTGGGMIPLIAMPAWMQTVSNFSLVKWGVLAIEGAIWRGFSWGEMALPLAILLAVGSAGFIIGSRALAKTEA